MPFNIKKDSQCDICFEPYNTSDRIPIALGCGHIFCYHCLRLSLKFSLQECGICRTNIRSYAKLHVTLDLPSSIDLWSERLRTRALAALCTNVTGLAMADIVWDLEHFLELQSIHEYQDLRHIRRVVSGVMATRARLLQLEQELSCARRALLSQGRQSGQESEMRNTPRARNENDHAQMTQERKLRKVRVKLPTTRYDPDGRKHLDTPELGEDSVSQ